MDNEPLEYFVFEQDFVEKGIRCIPMIVRKKMDLVGIKLKLAQWSKFNKKERLVLSIQACTTAEQHRSYGAYLTWLIKKYTDEEPVMLEPDDHPAWRITNTIPAELREKAAEFGYTISLRQWGSITELQRFALCKLCRPGHENKNFPKAMKEFGLTAEPAPGHPERSGS